MNKVPCLQFFVRTRQHGCLSGCHVHDRTLRSPAQTPHTDCQPETIGGNENLLGFRQAHLQSNPLSVANWFQLTEICHESLEQINTCPLL